MAIVIFRKFIFTVPCNPEFPFYDNRYVGAISEAAPVNTVVQGEDGNPLVIQATDRDRNHNALLVFQILDETARMFFTVDSGTGSIR